MVQRDHTRRPDAEKLLDKSNFPAIGDEFTAHFQVTGIGAWVCDLKIAFDKAKQGRQFGAAVLAWSNIVDLVQDRERFRIVELRAIDEFAKVDLTENVIRRFTNWMQVREDICQLTLFASEAVYS